MSRILVIGGFGFYGSRVVDSLRERGHRVVASSRALAGREGLEFDLGDPEGYAGLCDYDLVINASDTVGASPAAAARYVLDNGGTWMEMGAHAPTVERLLSLPSSPHPLGTVLVGVGVFPGLSTALARAVAERGSGCEQIELGVQLSPLSGAGPANCALMAESLFIPAMRFEGGEAKTLASAIGPAVELDYRNGSRKGVLVTLPDTHLIARATKAPKVATYFSLRPGWLRFNFLFLAHFVRLLRVLRGPLVWLLTKQLIVLRAILLRGVGTRVELLAVADRGLDSERSESLVFEDGHASTAIGVCAAAEAWLRRGQSQRPFGIHGVGELFTLDELRRYLDPGPHTSGRRPMLRTDAPP